MGSQNVWLHPKFQTRSYTRSNKNNFILEFSHFDFRTFVEYTRLLWLYYHWLLLLTQVELKHPVIETTVTLRSWASKRGFGLFEEEKEKALQSISVIAAPHGTILF